MVFIYFIFILDGVVQAASSVIVRPLHSLQVSLISSYRTFQMPTMLFTITLHVVSLTVVSAVLFSAYDGPPILITTWPYEDAVNAGKYFSLSDFVA